MKALVVVNQELSQNEKCLKFKINSSVNMSSKNDQFFEINYLCFFVSTAKDKSELGIIISKVKVHTSCFQNENFKRNKTYTTFFITSFKFSWTFLQLSFSIFNKLCFDSRDLLLQIYLNLFFIILHEILYT